MQDNLPAYRIKGLSKSYNTGEGPTDVLKDLYLDIEQGAFLSIIGPSGSGKTTLLNILGGIDEFQSGQLYCFDKKLSGISPKALSDWRARNISFIFQAYNLVTTLSAEQNISLPFVRTNFSAKEEKKRVAAALDLVGLTDRARHYPSELSGGQQQRVAIARALVSDAPILLCDEPTGNLDRESTQEILDILRFLNESRKKTIITVTHDAEVERFIGNTFDLSGAHQGVAKTTKTTEETL